MWKPKTLFDAFEIALYQEQNLANLYDGFGIDAGQAIAGQTGNVVHPVSSGDKGNRKYEMQYAGSVSSNQGNNVKTRNVDQKSGSGNQLGKENSNPNGYGSGNGGIKFNGHKGSGNRYVKKLPQEMQYRTNHGLCYGCGELYKPGHHQNCKMREFNIICCLDADKEEESSSILWTIDGESSKVVPEGKGRPELESSITAQAEVQTYKLFRWRSHAHFFGGKIQYPFVTYLQVPTPIEVCSDRSMGESDGEEEGNHRPAKKRRQVLLTSTPPLKEEETNFRIFESYRKAAAVVEAAAAKVAAAREKAAEEAAAELEAAMLSAALSRLAETRKQQRDESGNKEKGCSFKRPSSNVPNYKVVREFDLNRWSKYYQIMHDGQGFDITWCPDNSPKATIRPCQFKNEFGDTKTKFHQMCQDCIHFYNTKHEDEEYNYDWVVENVAFSRQQISSVYYVTFSASRVDDSSNQKTFLGQYAVYDLHCQAKKTGPFFCARKDLTLSEWNGKKDAPCKLACCVRYHRYPVTSHTYLEYRRQSWKENGVTLKCTPSILEREWSNIEVHPVSEMSTLQGLVS
ncbi:OLC1v1024074C1 [Oldenlandia corymbosa var. corymbosa]|uniref:OLC1v1024074C1 n=1 Tax=Oldenlandia corymbosa var. corymbosa TaxID=529605 RepID=A0AAV1C3T7_OLDCO|nr:OLC1v1024074C1 [Oldenlandia corymbosa var. corymbosa]